MKELLEAIAKGLVEDKDSVQIQVDEPTKRAWWFIIFTSLRMIWAGSSGNRAGLPKQSVRLCVPVQAESTKRLRSKSTDRQTATIYVNAMRGKCTALLLC